PARGLSSVYRSTLALLASIGAVAVVVGLIDAAWGWATLAAGLLAIVLYHVRHLARLARWAANPVAGQVPEGSGAWDEVLGALHRYERAAERREQQLGDALTRFRRAAQALPDGVVILDSANRIEWCNHTAELHLQIDGRADLGQPMANLVR